MKLATAAALLSLPSSASAVWGSAKKGASAAVKPTERSLQSLTGTFSSLGCNVGLDAANCSPWPHGTSAGAVEIPCGECVDMGGFTGGETVTVDGLNILGRLHFPEGTKVNLETPNIFVQGKLSMSLLSDPISGDPDVKITMTGDSEQTFTPHSDNSGACSGGVCDVGPKAIVVAGGQLDIDAIGDTCPTWSYVLDYTDAGMPNPTSGFPSPPSFDPETQASCTNTLLSSDFDDANKGQGGIDSWWGNVGAPASVEDGSHDGTKYLQVSRRTTTWQGPYRELLGSVEKKCLMADAVYIFSAKVRLTASSSAPDHVSSCSTDGTDCPGLRLSYMKPDDFVVWRDLAVASSAPSDGTWFDISGSFEIKSEWADPSNIFTTIAINGPEKEVDIAVDDFHIELAAGSLYPDPANVCAELASNGDAELGVAFPFRNYLASKPLSVIDVDDGTGTGSTTKAFYVTEREKTYHSLAFELVTGCLVPGSAYTFSAKIRVDSAGDITPKVQLRVQTAGQDPRFPVLATCPKVGNNRGFVQCTVDVTFEEADYNADLVVFFLNLISTSAADDTADAYFDDVSLAFKSGLESGGIHVDTQITSSCYAPGAEAVIPSDDLDYSRSQSVTLAGVDGTTDGLINVNENTVRIPTGQDQDAGAAGQFAFLSRKVEFEGEGGSLTVLGTPDVSQTIKGVGFIGFGQEGVLGRSPITFTSGGDSSGSVIAKNAIRSSKNRCVHISATNNLQVSENIAHDTLGHCFALQDGTGNVFNKNLGAVTRKATTAISGESDSTDPATFYTASDGGTWTDNVAGGSQSAGYLFDTSSVAAAAVNFTGNVAHSNLIAGFDTAESGLAGNTMTIKDFKAFRNTGPGIRLRSSTFVAVEGGYAADNRDGVLVWKGEGIVVTDMNIVGQTSIYRSMADSIPDIPKLCTGYSDGPAVGGVRVHPNGGATGVTVSSVSFSGFGVDAGCQPSTGGNTAAIALVSDDADLQLTYDTAITVSGLTFEAGGASRDRVNFCGPAGRGLYSIQVTDDGSLAPDGITLAAPTSVISEYMTCSTGPIELEGACAQYCNGGAVGEGTPPASSPTESATDNAGGVATTCVGDGTFENGLGGWYAGPSAAWSEASTTAGKGGGTAALSRLRGNPSYSGLWHNIDTASCLTGGAWYEVRADIRFVNNVTQEQFDCDPFNMWYGSPDSCPFGTLVLSRNPLDRIEVAPVVGPLNTVAEGGVVWQKLYGAFKASEDIFKAGTFPIMFSSAPKNVDLIVDNVVIEEVTDVANSVGAVDCASPIVNGDFETGDLRGWFARGNSNGGDLSLVSGYNGAGSAVKHSGDRTQRWHGILQLIPHECFTEGSTWTITAKFRVFDASGSAVQCNKGDPLADDSCPVFELSPDGDINNARNELPLVNTDSEGFTLGMWNKIRNTKVISADHAAVDTHFSWFTVNSVDPAWSYEIDDIVMTRD